MYKSIRIKKARSFSNVKHVLNNISAYTLLSSCVYNAMLARTPASAAPVVHHIFARLIEVLVPRFLDLNQCLRFEEVDFFVLNRRLRRLHATSQRWSSRSHGTVQIVKVKVLKLGSTGVLGADGWW